MQWNAVITFDAADQQGAADTVGTWTLTPGSGVIISPVISPVVGTVDDGGNVVENPTTPPLPAPEVTP